jgi:hypothetical protein
MPMGFADSETMASKSCSKAVHGTPNIVVPSGFEAERSECTNPDSNRALNPELKDIASLCRWSEVANFMG